MKNNCKITKEEFQKLNLNFRRLSSNFLNTNYNNYHRMLKKFLYFINRNKIIKEFIIMNINSDIDFSYLKTSNSHPEFELPIEDAKEISYIYQLLNYISDNDIDMYYISFRYGSREFDSKVRSFNKQIVKPLIDYINIYLNELKIDSGYHNNITNQFTFKQDFRGQINQATNNSHIKATQNYNQSDIENIKDVSSDFLNALTETQKINSDDKLALVELLEVTIQDLEKAEPKKSIIRIAMDKINEVTGNIDSATTTFILGTKLLSYLGQFL